MNMIAQTNGAKQVLLKASVFNILVPLRNKKALVYNSLTRQLASLEGERYILYRRLEQGVVMSDDDGVMALLESGYAVQSDKDELVETQKLYGKSRLDDTHLQLVIAPTLGCNFACDYCFQGLDKKHDKMTADTRGRIVDFVERNYPNLKSMEICWYGGEPLNDKASILALSGLMTEFCREKGLKYTASMVTNGYQFDGETAKELERGGMTWAQVTVDGPKEIHDTRRVLLSGKGTFDRILANLVEIRDQTDIKISLRCNVDSRNIDFAYDLVDNLYVQGFANSNISIYFAPIQTMTEECTSTNQYVEAKRSYAVKELALMRYAAERGLLQFSLPGVFNSICVGIKKNGWMINPNGDLHKCFDTVQRDDLKLGSIFEDWEKLDEEPRMALWRNWTPFTAPTCRDCKLLPSCAGSCAYKYIHSDKTKGDDTRLPCPSIKFSIAERLFESAIDQNLAARGDWDEDISRTTEEMVGRAYTAERLEDAVRAMDEALAGYEKRIGQMLVLARDNKLPSRVYEKLGKSREDFLALSVKRLKTTKASRELL